MRPLFFLLFGLASATTLAQKFRGEAALPTIQSDGFYRIFIPPALSPYLNEDFTNVRIYDQKNIEVPYLFQQEEPAYYTETFKEYEIVEKKQQKNCCTSLMLRNPDNNPINNISISIKNAEVTKQATLLGSDDKQNWFALKQHFVLNVIDNKNQTSEIKIVDFPLSNYTYYLIQIEDSTTAPLNILKAGYYEVSSEDGKYTEVSTFQLSKSDSTKEKKSYVQIRFDTTQVVDKLTLSMTGTTYFLRRASIATKKERTNRKKEKEYYYDWLYDFELSSKQPSVIELSGIQVNELLVTIENRDNPVLEVGTIKAYQLNRYLTAWLKKDLSYTIKLGEPELRAPDYDLGFFKDSIPNQPQVLAIGPITLFTEGQSQSPTLFTSRSIIWVAIVLVIVVLGFMSLKLVRETGDSDKAE